MNYCGGLCISLVLALLGCSAALADMAVLEAENSAGLDEGAFQPLRGMAPDQRRETARPGGV